MAKKKTKKKTKTSKKVAAKKPQARGLNPPKEGARPRGQAGAPTASQQSEYKKLIDKMREKDGSGAKFFLQLRYATGGHAEKLLQEKKTFGTRTLDEIAKDVGCKRLTLQQSINFFARVSKGTLAQLCELNPPPSWRMMGKWACIKDEDKWRKVLKRILSGELGPDGFEEQLRKMLDRGPSKPRRPKGASGMFQKINAEAVQMIQHLDWVDEAAKEVGAMEDVAAQRAAKTVVRDSVKELKSLQARLAKVLKACESLV